MLTVPSMEELSNVDPTRTAVLFLAVRLCVLDPLYMARVAGLYIKRHRLPAKVVR
jgi:hypothetical protein